MRKRHLSALLAAGTMAVAAMSAAGSAAAAEAGTAPTAGYIVVLKPGAEPSATAKAQTKARGAKVGHVYGSALRGYSTELRPSAAAALRNDPRVQSVQKDR